MRDERRRTPLAREDLLQVAISLVKSEGPHPEPAEFVSDVACTFEALSAETQDADTHRRGVLVAMPCVASRLGITNSFEPGLGWPKAS